MMLPFATYIYINHRYKALLQKGNTLLWYITKTCNTSPVVVTLQQQVKCCRKTTIQEHALII